MNYISQFLAFFNNFVVSLFNSLGSIGISGTTITVLGILIAGLFFDLFFRVLGNK